MERTSSNTSSEAKWKGEFLRFGLSFGMIRNSPFNVHSILS
jgi:hypothetical protein